MRGSNNNIEDVGDGHNASSILPSPTSSISLSSAEKSSLSSLKLDAGSGLDEDGDITEVEEEDDVITGLDDDV